MNTLDQVEKMVGRFYSHFLYRDLIYIGGGILVLGVPAYQFGLVSSLKAGPAWLLVPATLAAYAMGFFAQELGLAIGLYRLYPRGDAWDEAEVIYYRRRVNIGRNLDLGEEAVLQLERIIHLKHLSATLGSSSLVALIYLLTYYVHGKDVGKPFLMADFTIVVAIITLLLVVLAMCRRNRAMVLAQERLAGEWDVIPEK